MSFAKWLAGGRSAEKKAYVVSVNKHLKEDLHLDTVRDERFRVFDEIVEKGWVSKVLPKDVALQVATAFYVTQSMGDAADRNEATQLYVLLTMSIRLASLDDTMSFQRCQDFLDLIGKHTREALMRDMEEGTFSSEE